MKQVNVYKFKKGMKVPPWVQHVTGELNNLFVNMLVEFRTDGKIFVMDNKDLIITTRRMRKRESVIYVKPTDKVDVTVTIKGAGDNEAHCHMYSYIHDISSVMLARKYHKIKNKAKCEFLPIYDPRK